MHKRVSNPVTYVNASKIRTTHSDIMVRNRYFQHKPTGKRSSDTENEKLFSKIDVIMGDCENKDSLIESGTSAGLKKRKTLVKSSSFQQKSAIDELDRDDGNDENQDKDGFCVHVSGYLSEKVQSSMDCSIAAHAFNPISSNSASNFENTEMKENTEVEKFGSNISHLDNYSNIAEKPIEKFVSVISSLRCSPKSGSRASGLRAPLKDVSNTPTLRSTLDVYLSQFAYVPTKKKVLPSRTFRKR